MKRILSIGAASLALILGLTSCKKTSNGADLPEEGSTYVAVSLSFPAETRALPDGYNKVGEWAGKDKIESVAIYVVDVTSGVVSTGQFEVGDFQSLAGGVLKPKKGIKTTKGQKRVYALINGTPDIISTLATSGAVDFEKKFKEEVHKLANSGKDKVHVSTSASKIAQVKGAEDVITMTNSEECALEVQDGVKEAQAVAGPANLAHIKVERASARVMVTTKADSYKVTRPVTDEEIGTVTDVKWVLAQGEDSFYLQRKANFETPKYAFKPTNDDYYTPAPVGYDYSGLWEEYKDAASKQISGTAVPPLAAYQALNSGGNNKEQVLQSLGLDANAVNGKFILPTNHAIGDKSTTGFNKGNTAYVLVRARFTPKTFADGTDNYQVGQDFFLGANGKFYISKENAQNPAKNGVAKQKVAKYTGGKVLYFAWLNPDNVAEPINSPVLRNHIYHVHIKGFKSIGTNWNPLVPGDDPKTPDDDDNNPDPKPDDPDEPENPIKPDDPLTTPETWMSVDITVLPWTVHSYEIDLQI